MSETKPIRKIHDAQSTINELQRLLDEGQINQVFAVGFNDSGTFFTRYAGEWHNLAISSAALQNEFGGHMSSANL